MRGAADFHVAGVLAQLHPDCAVEAGTSIASLRGVLIHAATAEGKLVLTLEGSDTDVAERLHEIQGTPGVVSAVLVYQHSETIDEEPDV